MVEKVLRYDGAPRRCDTQLRTSVETIITDAMHAVEALGGDPLLTDAVTLLDQAREKVADWVDSRIVQIQG